MNKVLTAKAIISFVLCVYFMREYNKRKKKVELKQKVADAKRTAKWDYIETCFVD